MQNIDRRASRPRACAALALLLTACAAPALARDREAAARELSEARATFLQGRFRDAMSSADSAISDDSGLGDAYALRARLWSALGDQARARADAKRALDKIGSWRLTPDDLLARGDAYLAAGDPERAMRDFDAAVTATNRSAEALAERARGWIALGEPTKARADLDAALSIRAKVPLWLYARARLRYEQGDDAGAIDDLTSALVASRDFPAAFGLLGAALARRGDLPRARKAYDKALSLDAAYEFPYLGRAALSLREGNAAAAMKDFENAVRADGQDYAPYFNRGEARWRAGDRDAALDDYRNALAAPMLAAPAAIAIGDRYVSLRLWKDAIDAYTRAAAVARKPAQALARRATAEESEDRPKEALQDLDVALRGQPDETAVLVQRGRLEARLGMDKEALKDFDRAVRLKPKDPSILVARASYLAGRGRAELAMQDFNDALASDPNDADAYNGRGALYANAYASTPKALDDVRRAVALDPGVPAYEFNLGMLLLKDRDYQKAIDAFSRALALKGPAALILQQRAEAKFQLGDHVGATYDIESALEKAPKNPALYDTLGSMRLRSGEYEQAVRDLNQAVALDDSLAAARLHRGLAYGGLGQLRPALEDLDRATKLAPQSKEAWTALCQAQRLQGEDKESQRDCDRAIAIDSQYGPAYLQRALTRLALKNYPRTIDDVESAWQLGVRRAQGLLAESVAQAALRQYRAAHLAYMRAISVDPYARSAYVGFSPGHPQGDDYLSAIAALNDQMTRDEQRDPYVYVVRADSLHNAEQFDKAVLEYTKAMEADGTIADAYIGRGTSLTAQNSLDAAQQDFVRAIELKPDDAAAHVSLAVTLTIRRNYSGALDQLAQALKIDPKSASARVREGNVYYFEGRYQQALDSYAKAAEDDPLDPNALNGLGLGSFALRRYDPALEFFSRAIALNPLSDRYYRNRASVWTAEKRYGNAAGDFRIASLVNTDPSLVDQYRKMIEEAQSRASSNPS
ncbi:MAG: tetratricopeptide repeat protein [Elusimicrobia bacterium]|nr:tetratricopeptide repeat protein [Elusimicrobiota bacterium]